MDPNVKFLYRTMQERGPNKRRVKPVAPELIQTNFEGFDDSDDDSDFDIAKVSSGGNVDVRDKGQVKPSSTLDNDDSTLDTDSDNDDDDDDDGSEDEDDDMSEYFDDEGEGDNDADDYTAIDDEVTKANRTIRSSKPIARVEGSSGDQEMEADVDSMLDSDRDGASDVDDDDETTDCSDDEDDDEEGEEEEEADDGNEEDESSKEGDVAGEKELLSPPIKSLENIWNSIDSDEDDEDYVPRKKRKKKGAKITTKTAKLEGKKKDKPPSSADISDKNKKNSTVADPQQKTQLTKKIKVVVCCVCLSDKGSEEEEIVECDSCGISVHEGCYGIGESHSIASTESSASTEPWFCDACKANAIPVCELCPNAGGVFKETDNGKWVHLVCALYTPGVAFGDVDKLSHVTLFEMPYSKWGARECILCEDPRFSQTGVCVNCDAGMCKAYFHVTCAQREGLLAELSPDDVLEVADPFFAYCKLHADKYLSKMKRRNWLAVQSHSKSYAPCPITDEKEKARFQRKLAHHREKYGLAKQKRPPAWLPTHKLVRHLHTSPSALKGFLRKAELMGILTQVQNTPMETKELKKAAPGSVSFTSDFISYFLERNVKVDSLKAALGELEAQNKRLHSQEKVVRQHYEKVNTKVSGLRQVSNKIRMEGESLCGMLADIYGKSVPNIPEVFMGRKNRAGGKKDNTTANQSSQLIQQCGVCHKTTDQHLLANCDNCHKHYHLGCLDPPLTRMPKKTKLFGWQCSFCAKSSSEGSVKSHPDVNQPRRLRETIKGPDKFFLLSHIQDSLTSQRKKSLQSRRSKKRHKTNMKRLKQGKTSSQWKVTSPGNPSSFPKTSPKTKSQSGKSSSSMSAHVTSHSGLQVPSLEDLVDLDIICVVCNKEGQAANTVRCDDCMLSYHLQCLSPPMKKSPKVRGYAWHCEACDMSDSVAG